jgi:hypothetical protein
MLVEAESYKRDILPVGLGFLMPSAPICHPSALGAFEATARRMSFSKAADELYVTLAAISHQIAPSWKVRRPIRCRRALRRKGPPAQPRRHAPRAISSRQVVPWRAAARDGVYNMMAGRE